MQTKQFDVVVLGSGRIGTTLGILLHKRGFQVCLVGKKQLFGPTNTLLFNNGVTEETITIRIK